MKDIRAEGAAARAAVAVAAENLCGDAADSGLPGRARAATPGGTRSNRNAAATRPTTPRTRRSSRAADRAAANNLRESLLGAGPRRPPRSAGAQQALPPGPELATWAAAAGGE